MRIICSFIVVVALICIYVVNCYLQDDYEHSVHMFIKHLQVVAGSSVR